MSTHTSPKQPSEASLREAALRHLARFPATQQRLTRVLDRRIDRWLTAARAAAPEDTGLSAHAAAARQAARRVVAALAASKVVDDAAYALSRARALLRTGKSRAAVASHLALRGIDPETLRAAVPEDAERERGAALLLARRRRIGPFAPGPEDPTRALGILARAGFSHDIARAALATPAHAAEALIEAVRRR